MSNCTLRIGDIEIDPPVVLAPLAGITNYAFRRICREFGAGAVWTEMISSFGIFYKNGRTLAMFDWQDDERPTAVQLFGADPDAMAAAAEAVQKAGADMIDLNMGCPVPKVRKTGAGSALMDDLEVARKVISAVVNASSVPVTLKTRKGPHPHLTTAMDLARLAEDCGVSAISVHGRTAAQLYSGTADWEIIRDVKRSVGIPVIGNGDVKTPEDAKHMLEITGCDGVMIGRAALGNPWVFSRTAEFLKTGILPPEPSFRERVEVARRHLHLLVDLHGEIKAVHEMRGQIVKYLTGIPGASKSRRLLTEAGSMQEMENALAGISG